MNDTLDYFKTNQRLDDIHNNDVDASDIELVIIRQSIIDFIGRKLDQLNK